MVIDRVGKVQKALLKEMLEKIKEEEAKEKRRCKSTTDG
jgi:hypothetical protein